MKKQKRRPRMDLTTLILLILSGFLLLFLIIKDKNLALDGLRAAGSTLWDNIVILLVGFLLAGMIQVLIPKESISNWLGNKAGAKAVLIGCVAGGLIPGSPYAVFPIAGGFYKAGAGLGAIVSFISAWSLWSVTRLPVEIALINPRVALIRYIITFFVPPIAGFIAQLLSKAIMP